MDWVIDIGPGAGDEPDPRRRQRAARQLAEMPDKP